MPLSCWLALVRCAAISCTPSSHTVMFILFATRTPPPLNRTNTLTVKTGQQRGNAHHHQTTCRRASAEHCPLACGICTLLRVCRGERKMRGLGTSRTCPSRDNPLSLLRDCPITCGICLPECTDSKYQCSAWADAGGLRK